MGSVFPLLLVLLLISSALPSLSSMLSITEEFTVADDKATTNIQSTRLLDLLIRDFTVKLFNGKNFKTGDLNSVHLPTNLSGIEVNTARFRCGSLRRYGAKIKEFHLGKNVTINPCVERVIFIRQELGLNWSSIYYDNYDLQGYELVTPILGLLAYNGGDDYLNISSPNPFELRIMADDDPVRVDFTNVTKTKSLQGKMLYCASFEGKGNVTFASMVSPNICAAKMQGHFGLVVETKRLQAPSPSQYTPTISRWKVALGSAIGAALGAFLLGLLMVAMLANAKKKYKLEELVRRAYEEEALQVSMVGHVRAPVATPTRTVPIIEHNYRPPYF